MLYRALLMVMVGIALSSVLVGFSLFPDGQGLFFGFAFGVVIDLVVGLAISVVLAVIRFAGGIEVRAHRRAG